MKKLNILLLVLFVALSLGNCTLTDTVRLKNGQSVKYHTEWGVKVFYIGRSADRRKCLEQIEGIDDIRGVLAGGVNASIVTYEACEAWGVENAK